VPNKPIDNYYNRFDSATPDRYDEILFRDGYGAQASEHNELQGMLKHRIRSVAEALFKDGDVVKDAQIAVNAQTGEVQAGAGLVYLQGAVRSVAAATFLIPASGSVAVGVRLVTEMISELEDPSLLNPAVGVGTFGEPGGWRLRVRAEWGFSGDGGSGDFYPVHIADDGVVRSKEAPPNLDAFNQAISRYDRDSTGGGTYIVAGLVVRAAGNAGGGAQIYTVTEGRARVYGYGIDLPTSRRLSYPALPDVRCIDTEVHTATGESSLRIDVAHAPIRNITALRVTLRKTVQVVHGAYTGVADTLPDISVAQIVECRQGETVYVPGTDYKKTGDAVDWSLAGNEPAPGSTFGCTYDHIAAVEPVLPDFDGFTVENTVPGSSIIISYNQALPRLDRLCLTQDGAFVWQRGVAAEINPRPPVVPEGMLAVATIRQTWRDHSIVNNDGVRVTSFDALEALTERVDFVLSEMARQRLESDAATRENGTRVGIFVDPLLDDSMRDQGISQSAAVFGGIMTLSVTAAAHMLAAPLDAPATAAYTPAVLLEQSLRTGDMKVNPYMAFAVLPARVTINPAIDQWTEIETMWASPVTERFETGHYVPGNSTLTSSSTTAATQLLAASTKSLEYLRQIAVKFRIEGFGAGEILQQVIFDGVPAAFTPATADAQGIAVGNFTVPAKIPAGSKTVTFTGMGGTTGSAVFVGQGQLTIQVLRQINTVVNYWVDPLAQTFVPEQNTQLCGVDLWFTAKNTEVRVQIREVRDGVPTRVILAETAIRPQDIVVIGGGHTRVLFPLLVQLFAGTEYALVVLCNDPITAVSVADMGKFDAVKQQWVTSQAYTVGVLLSSGNASTWTAHQDKDLAFRLLAAGFASGVTQIDMGGADVADATDILVLSVEDTPTADTRIEYELTLPDGAVLLVGSGQPVRPATPVTGMITVKARLSGTSGAAPLLWPGAQLLAGTLNRESDYYTRSISAVDAIKAVLIYDAYIPSGASVTPEIQVDGGAWEAMTGAGTTQQGDGVVEYRCEYDLSEAALVKARFTLTGTGSARPAVYNIRFMALI
jgi:hypothetical protein